MADRSAAKAGRRRGDTRPNSRAVHDRFAISRMSGLLHDRVPVAVDGRGRPMPVTTRSRRIRSETEVASSSTTSRDGEDAVTRDDSITYATFMRGPSASEEIVPTDRDRGRIGRVAGMCRDRISTAGSFGPTDSRAFRAFSMVAVPMLADFGVRLAFGLIVALTLTSWRAVPLRFFRLQSQIALGILVLAALSQAGFGGTRSSSGSSSPAPSCSYLASVTWGLGLPPISPALGILTAPASRAPGWSWPRDVSDPGLWSLIVLGSRHCPGSCSGPRSIPCCWATTTW